MQVLKLQKRDQLDQDILFQLQENSRQSTANLSKKLKAARSTIHERISKLERDGVIVGYTAVISQEPNIPSVQALLFLEVAQGRTGLVSKVIEKYSEVKSCYALTGEFDLFCSLEASYLEDIDKIIEEISSLSHVKNTSSKIVLAKKFDRNVTYVRKSKEMGLTEQAEVHVS